MPDRADCLPVLSRLLPGHPDESADQDTLGLDRKFSRDVVLDVNLRLIKMAGDYAEQFGRIRLVSSVDFVVQTAQVVAPDRADVGKGA